MSKLHTEYCPYTGWQCEDENGVVGHGHSEEEAMIDYYERVWEKNNA